MMRGVLLAGLVLVCLAPSVCAESPAANAGALPVGASSPATAGEEARPDSPAAGASWARPDTAIRPSELVLKWEELAAIPEDGRVAAMALWQENLYAAAASGKIYRLESGRWQAVGRLPAGEGQILLCAQELLYAAQGSLFYRFIPGRAAWEKLADFSDSVPRDARVRTLIPFTSRSGSRMVAAGLGNGWMMFHDPAAAERYRFSPRFIFRGMFPDQPLTSLAGKDNIIFAGVRDGAQLGRSDGFLTKPVGGFDTAVVMLETVKLPERSYLLVGTADGSVYLSDKTGARINSSNDFRRIVPYPAASGLLPLAAAGCGGNIMLAGRNAAGDLQVWEYRPDADTWAVTLTDQIAGAGEVAAAGGNREIFVRGGKRIYRGHYTAALSAAVATEPAP